METKVLRELYRTAADDIHGEEGTCEIDENAQVSISDDKTAKGAYVQAWVWVYDTDAGVCVRCRKRKAREGCKCCASCSSKRKAD